MMAGGGDNRESKLGGEGSSTDTDDDEETTSLFAADMREEKDSTGLSDPSNEVEGQTEGQAGGQEGECLLTKEEDLSEIGRAKQSINAIFTQQKINYCVNCI